MFLITSLCHLLQVVVQMLVEMDSFITHVVVVGTQPNLQAILFGLFAIGSTEENVVRVQVVCSTTNKAVFFFLDH